jgi:pimeloyl-ACP methyl ester carboxylesterase
MKLSDGRELEVHDSAEAGGVAGDSVLVWHLGTPHTGALLSPVVAAAAAHGIRVVTYARPSYGSSTGRPGRAICDAAADVEQIVDALGIGSFATAGYSGGGPHALACAALMPERVSAVMTFGGVAPFTDEFDWFAGMQSDKDLRSAFEGRAARAARADLDEFDMESFVAADWAALQNEWAAMNTDVGAAGAAGPDGPIDDDVALATPWGFTLAQVAAPVLVVQGELDRIVPPAHGEYLARHLPNAELLLRPDAGHVAVLNALPTALDWLAALR